MISSKLTKSKLLSYVHVQGGLTLSTVRIGEKQRICAEQEVLKHTVGWTGKLRNMKPLLEKRRA